MKTTNFDWGDNVIDSRDLIAREEELREEYNDLKEAVDYAFNELKVFQETPPDSTDESEVVEDYNNEVDTLSQELADANVSIGEWENDYLDEFEMLIDIISQGEDSPDWNYGETLIHENYFTAYIEELVNDCYEMPKEFTEGKWPWNHASIDWESAADEAKQDYTTIDSNRETYYIRA
jgi:hypothetical protein